MKIDVIDNFLDADEFLKIKTTLLGVDFPWFYQEDFEYESKRLCDEINNHCFTHMFYKDHIPQSQYINILSGVIEKINPKSLVRIKSNLSIKTSAVQKFGFHVDYPDYDCNTSILYVNTNDGKTVFENGEEIESVENRLVTFNSNILHSGTTCTNKKHRCLINFNYF